MKVVKGFSGSFRARESLRSLGERCMAAGMDDYPATPLQFTKLSNPRCPPTPA